MASTVCDITPVQDLPGPCLFPRPAKSTSSLRDWLVSKGRGIAPQCGQCLLTLERYPESAVRCTRLVPPDIQRRAVATTPHISSGPILIGVVQAIRLEWSWGLAPSTLDIDSDDNLLIREGPLLCAFASSATDHTFK